MLQFVFRYLPTQLDFVTTQLDAFREARFQVGVAGSLALIWSSLGVFGAVTSAVNEAWGVEKRRSFLKHRLVSFLMLAAAGLFLVTGLCCERVRVAEAWFGVMLRRFRVEFQSWGSLRRDDGAGGGRGIRLLLHPQRRRGSATSGWARC